MIEYNPVAIIDCSPMLIVVTAVDSLAAAAHSEFGPADHVESISTVAGSSPSQFGMNGSSTLTVSTTGAT